MNSTRSKTASQYNIDTEVPIEWNVGDLVLDTYEVKEIFGSGAMAYVYRVHHRDWDIDLAVKSPKPGKLRLGGMVDLFVREAENWVNLGLYPHIVSCYYIRVFGGIPRIFMEYVDGASLLEVIEDNSLYQGSMDDILQRLLDISIQFAWGLHYAHEKGLVHQDVKPANVMLTRDNIAKVTDFGMAQAKNKLWKREEGVEMPILSADGESILVDTVGMTPAYCSPEQAAAQPLSRRTDIWSWAVSVLEMFVGRRSWKKGPVAPEALDKYIQEGPADASKPTIPGSLADLLRRCLSENPEDRPGDMRLIATYLQAVYRGEIGKHYQRPEPHVKTTLADTLNNRGVSMADLGNDKEAMELFNIALQAESTHPTAIYNRSRNLWNRGEITDQDAVESLLDNQKNLSDSSETFFLLSLLHLERGDSERAARILDEAIETYGARPELKRVRTLAEQTLKISGRCLKTYIGNESSVNAVAISSNGKLVFSGGNDGKVRMWKVKNEECEKTFNGHTHLIQTLALSPDEKHLLSGSWDHSVRLWEIESGECLQEFTEHTDIIQQVAFTPDGEFAVSASSDCTLRVWDLHSGDCVQNLSEHFDTVSAFVISKDGKKIISASYDNRLRVWDLVSGKCEKTIEWVKSCTSNLALRKDGKKVLLAGAEALLWLVDLETGESVRSYSGHEGTVKAVQIAPNGTWVLSAATDGTMRLWDLKTSRCLRTYAGHDSSVNAVAVCSKKVLAVTGSSDATVKLWWLSAGAKFPYIPVLPRSSEEIIELTDQIEAQMAVANQKYKQGDYAGALAIVAEARAIPGYQQNPHLLKDWDRIGLRGVRQRLRSTWLVQSYPAHLTGVNSVAITGGGKFALTGSDDAKVSMWDLRNGNVIRQLSGHEAEVRSVDAAQRVQQALSGSADGTLRLWQLKSGKCLHVMSGHTRGLNSVAMTFDGRLALSGSNDNTLRLWSLPTGECLSVLRGHENFVSGVAFSPDMRLGLSVSWDKTVRVWDLATGGCLRVIEGHTEAIDALAISPDGAFVLTGGLDHTLVLWNIITGEPVKLIEDIPTRIVSVAFCVDRRFIFSGEMDGTVNIWNLSEGKSEYRFIAHSGPVNCLDISTDGRFLTSVGSDRILNLWRLDWDFSFLSNIRIDRTSSYYLNTFIAQHRPYPKDGVEPRGKPAWNKNDFNKLMRTLSYRGYGRVSPREVNSWLKKLAKRAR